MHAEEPHVAFGAARAVRESLTPDGWWVGGGSPPPPKPFRGSGAPIFRPKLSIGPLGSKVVVAGGHLEGTRPSRSALEAAVEAEREENQRLREEVALLRGQLQAAHGHILGLQTELEVRVISVLPPSNSPAYVTHHHTQQVQIFNFIASKRSCHCHQRNSTLNLSTAVSGKNAN